MSKEIENIQKILKMKSLKKEYDRKKYNPIKEDIALEELYYPQNTELSIISYFI